MGDSACFEILTVTCSSFSAAIMMMSSWALAQMYNFGAKFILVLEFECFCLAIGHHCSSARLNCHWHYSSQEGPWRFWLHCHGCRCVQTLMCQNSPWWRWCERNNNFLSSFWTPLLIQLKQHGRRVACALIGMSRKLAAYNYTGSLEQGLIWACGWKQSLPRYPQGQTKGATRSAIATCNI